jgi:glycerol uptake facilitator-like aquaporin
MSAVSYIGPVATEFIGTFIFISVILAIGEPVAVAITFLATLYFAAKYTAATSFNPAVSLVYLIRGNIDWITFILYTIVELLAAGMAFGYYKLFLKS